MGNVLFRGASPAGVQPLPLAEAGVLSRRWGLTLVQADRLGKGLREP